MENIGEIIEIISDIAKNMKIDEENFSLDDCIKILDKSDKLEEYLDENITPPIFADDIDSIKNEFVKTILCIYIDRKDIEVETDSSEETLDEYVIYNRYISKHPVLDKEQERKLFIAYNNGDMEAKYIIAMSNQRLVKSIAKRFVSENYSYMSAIQDGNLGLLKAIQEFDVSLGYKFSTFAIKIINQTICFQKIPEVNSVPIPKSAEDDLFDYNKLCMEYKEKYGKPLDDKMAASLLNITLDTLLALKKLNNGVVSLNQTVNNNADEETELIYFLEDENTSVENQVINGKLHDALITAMSDLTDREKFVLIQRFGLDGENPKTLKEVGTMINRTREAARLVEKKALNKLRNPKRGRALREYLYN